MRTYIFSELEKVENVNTNGYGVFVERKIIPNKSQKVLN